MSTETTYDGGCLCGAVRYRSTQTASESVYCHCRMCQRSTGAPVVAWITVPASTFDYVKGTPKIHHSSKQAQREFCPDCGTQLVFRKHDLDSVDITTASLDEPARFPPKLHIWRESRIPWFETNDTLPRSSGS